jgi:hypothetical protein
MLAVLVFGVLCGFGIARQLPENNPVSANDFVRKIVANEIKDETRDHSHWAFQLRTEKAGRTELYQVVETKDGNLQLRVAINGRPLAAKQKQRAKLHVQNLVRDPGAARKSLRGRVKTLLAPRACSSCCLMHSSSAMTTAAGTW